MTEPDWSAMKERLEQQRAQTMARMRATGDYGLDDSMADALGELSLYDNHPADIGSELFERGKDLALRDGDKLTMQEIDRALQAIERGTYGTCQRCGQPIPGERLEARPSAVLCVTCKEADEQAHPNRDRPVEEEFLTPGFGRTNLDDTSSVAFDGEDSWQAVERYNQRSGYAHMVEESTYDENVGTVEDIEQISNQQYKEQLP